MAYIEAYISDFSAFLPRLTHLTPWEIPGRLPGLIPQLISRLDTSYHIQGDIAIHHTSTLEEGVMLKAPLIIHEDCFIGAHAYLRGGVILGSHVTIGPSCEIKSSIICERSGIAHFNFIGDSIIGSGVNFEAGAITANHYNERKDKKITVFFDGNRQQTGVEKFGALVGDGSKIGANAVLSPGTVLKPDSIVGRLELVEQNP